MSHSKLAVILIGYQNDYFAADGALHKVIESSAEIVLENTLTLLNLLAAKDILCISTPIVFTPAYDELTDPVGILKVIKEVGAFRANSKGGQVIPELQLFGDRIISVPGKRGLNAFSNTRLDEILKASGVQHIVLCGAVTSICIDSTGRSAHERGYQVTVLSDCTCARTDFEQDFYLRQVFPLYAQVMASNDFLRSV